MSRLMIPEDFPNQQTLLGNVGNKNQSMGVNSPIKSYLTEHEIVLADDKLAGDDAKTHDTNRSLYSRQSENYRQLRDNNFDLPWKHLKGGVQFLKSFYKGNTSELGNWGIPITGGGKINYPPSFTERAQVFADFLAKHQSFDPDPSPLQPYLTQQNIDMDIDAARVDAASTYNTNFINASQQSENETEQRDLLWNPVLQHLRDIGAFLMKLNINNQKSLGDWGYVVDDSPQKAKPRNTKLKLGEQITSKSVVIGSVMTNTGEGDLHIYRGKSTTGTPFILHAGEKFGILKGWGTITVVNPSTLIGGSFTWMTNG